MDHYDDIAEVIRPVPPAEFRQVEVNPGPDDFGATSVNRDVISLTVPVGMGYRERVVRMHEMLHSRISFGSIISNVRRDLLSEVCPLAIQATDDVYIHRRFPCDDDTLKRAARRVAREDMRVALSGEIKRNLAILTVARSVSLAMAAGVPYGRLISPPSADSPLDYSDLQEIRAVVHRLMMYRSRAAQPEAMQAYVICARVLDALMDSPTSPERDGERRQGGVGSPEGEVEEMLPVMAIIAPPLPRQISGRLLARVESRTTCGRLTRRPSDVVRGIVARDARMLFTRRRPAPGGTVLVDASGSMHLSHGDLMAIAERFPAGLVAAYGGYSAVPIPRAAQWGELHVLAKRGRVAEPASVERFPVFLANNSIDLWALRWLLQQPAPRIIVTDGRYCGGPPGQALAAVLLLRRAVKARALTHYETLEGLTDAH